MTVDILDKNTPVRVTGENDFFHELCKNWTNGETVHDLMKRESDDRVRHAYDAGHQAVVNHLRAQEEARTITIRVQAVMQPSFHPISRVRETRPIPVVAESLSTHKTLVNQPVEVSHDWEEDSGAYVTQPHEEESFWSQDK